MGIDRIDDIVFDRCDFVIGKAPFQHDHLGGKNRRALLAGEDLHALSGGIGALVELPRKVFHGKSSLIFTHGEGGGGLIHLGFREDVGGGFVEFDIREPINVVALDDTDVFQPGQAEGFTEVMQEVARLGIVGGFFFNENTVHQRRGFGKRRMLKNGTARASGMGRPQSSVWENACWWSLCRTESGIGVGSGYSKTLPSKFRKVTRPGAVSMR